MYPTLFTVLALLSAVACHYYPAAWNTVPVRQAPQCVLGDQLRYLPMYVVPEREIKVLQDYRTKYYTPSPAVVSFIGQKQSLPAVRVVLSNPIPVTSWKTFIEFPTTFTILQDGYRLPFPVSAVYAPLPEREFIRSPHIHVVYAVPASPAPAPVAITTTSTTTEATPFRQNITVLHFPDAIAEPQFLYQEEDDELGGRNPPVPVVPAGIVQSSAPVPGVTVFFNSKESPVLQLLRDEANHAFMSGHSVPLETCSFRKTDEFHEN